MKKQCKFGFPGFAAHLLPTGTEEVRRRCLILVKNTIPHNVVDNPVKCGEDVDTLAARFFLKRAEVDVCNVYRSQRVELDLTELPILATETNIIVGRDFSAHHDILGSRSETSATGRHVTTLPEELDEVTLLNDGEPTHLQGNTLNLTLATFRLAS